MKRFFRLPHTLTLLAVLAIALFFVHPVAAQQVGPNAGATALGLNQNIQGATGLGNEDIRVTIAKIIRVALGLIGIVMVVLMVYAGYSYMTAGGDDEQLGNAKKIIRNAVIGLVIILSAYAIVSFVINALLGASNAVPAHCFNGIQDADETGVDSGGSCGDGNNGPGGILAGNLYVISLPNGGSACIANFHPIITFSRPVDLASFTPDAITIIKKVDSSVVPGAWQYAAPNNKNAVVFLPVGSCGVGGGNDCFEASTTFELRITEDKISKVGKIKSLAADPKDALSLRCDLKDGCGPVSFKTGNTIDRKPPTITFEFPGANAPLVQGDVVPVRLSYDDDVATQLVELDVTKGNPFSFTNTLLAPGYYLGLDGGSEYDHIAVADINKDKNPDVILSVTSSSTVNVYLGDGIGGFKKGGSFDFPNIQYDVDVGDVNGDGNPDLVAVFQKKVFVALGNGKSGFSLPVQTINTQTSNQLSVQLADVNNDGKLDILYLSKDGATVHYLSVLLNKGDGTFFPDKQFKLDNYSADTSIAVGDFNGDGFSDVATPASKPSSAVQILLNNKDGSFASSTNFDILLPPNNTISNPSAVAVGDFNKDGKLDLAVTHLLYGGGDSVSVHIGKGDGTFLGGVFYTVANAPVDVAVADFNGDKNPDLVVASQYFGWLGSAGVLLGNGDGTFGKVVTSGINPNNIGNSKAFDIRVADVNKDGVPDVIESFNSGGGPTNGFAVFPFSGAPTNQVLDLVGTAAIGNCQASGTVQIPWNTAGFATGTYTLYAKSFDYAAQMGTSTRLANLLPATCFNNVLDPGEDKVGPPACGVNSVCGACAGSPCKLDLDCAGGLCVIGGNGQGVCVNKAKITGFSPPAAGPGSFVTVSGYFFGSSPGQVFFAKNPNPNVNDPNDWILAPLAPCSFAGWTDRQIIVTVPVGAVTGPIKVVTDKQIGADGVSRVFTDTTKEEGLNDFVATADVLPGICGVNPAAGAPGETAIIIGKKFGLLDKASDVVQFGKLKASTKANSWKDDQINTTIPNLDQGYTALSVFADGKESNRVQFEVTALGQTGLPVITSISPNKGPEGQYITILGNNFGTLRGQVWFKANAQAQAILGDFNFPPQCSASDVWQNSQIIVKFPKGAGVIGQNYLVQVLPVGPNAAPSAISNAFNFSLTAGVPSPGLCKVDPVSGAVPFTGGTVASLYGEYFQAGDILSTLPPNALVHYFNLDQSTLGKNTAADLVQKGFTATVFGTPAVVTGVHDDALSLDGAKDQYVSVPNGADINNLPNYTIAVWVRWRGVRQPQDASPLAAYGSVVGRHEDNVFDNTIIALDNADPSKAHLVYFANDTKAPVITSKRTLDQNVWHQIVLSVAGATHSLYIDSALAGTATVAGQPANRPNVPLLFGRWLKSANVDLDDIILYNRTLDANEVAKLGSAGGVSDVYFWKTGADNASINGRSKATVVDATAVVVHAQPTGDVESGSVVAFRPVDGAMSNGLPFSVLNCLKNNNQCGDPGLKCCLSGNDAGSCKKQNDLCAGETRSTGYVWRFATKDIPPIPHVVERCDDDGVILNPTLPSPSPSVLWRAPNSPTSTDPAYNVCRNAVSYVEFSAAMDQATVNNQTVAVYKCSALNNDGTCKTWSKIALDNSSFTLQAAAKQQNVSRDYLALMPNAKRWDDNSWYQVALGSAIKSAPGPSGGVPLAGDKSCDGLSLDQNGPLKNTAYCFSFRTDSQDCKLRAVIVTPYQYYTSYLEAPMVAHNNDGTLGNPISYAGNGLSTQRCVMMDVSNYDWSWSADKPNKVVYADIFGPANQRTAKVSSLQNTVGVLQSDSVDISATASRNLDTKTGTSPLTIDLSSPEVVETWPTCLEACTNAEVGARFNVTLSNKNLPGDALNGTVQLLECADENCLSTQSVLDTNQVYLDQSSHYTVLKIDNSRPGANPLKPNTKYKVVLSTVAQKGQTPPNQIWSSYKFNDPSPQSAGAPYNKEYVWSFKTKATPCFVDHVGVSPASYVASSILERVIFSAVPYSSPDSCSKAGQKLDPWSINWQWKSSDQKVAEVQTFSTKTQNPSCTASCVRKGSDIAAGNPPVPVCGNGAVEAGEDCDPPSKNGYCGLDCRFLPADPKNCGNGVLDQNEVCDPKDPKTQVGCSATCQHLGSSATPNPNNPNLSICGNGTVGSGEDCDLGIKGDLKDPQSALGCSAVCLHQGTKLAKAWCEANGGGFGGFDQKSFDAACGSALSVCGDGVVDADEDVDCDGNGGWNSKQCDDHCILKTYDSAADIDKNSCGLDPKNVPEGCNDSLQHVGSSVLYVVPSVCGDGVVGTGEDATCENNLSGKALSFNPWALVKGVGLGPVNQNTTPPEQTTKISASTNEQTLNNSTVASSSPFTIQCGYHADQECAAIDPSLGVGADTCCYARPEIVAVYPVTSTLNKPILDNVCPNTAISVQFTQHINPASLTGSIIIAQGQDTPCAGNTSDVTAQVAIANHVSPVRLAWYNRLVGSIVELWRSLWRVSPASAGKILQDPKFWCAGNDLGTPQVQDVLGAPSQSKVVVTLPKPLAEETNYAVILTAGIKNDAGVSLGQKGYSWKFNTAVGICEVNKVLVSPSQEYFASTAASTTFEAVGSHVDAQGQESPIQPIPGYYAWKYVWGPDPNDFVKFDVLEGPSSNVSAKGRNGEIDIRAAATVTDNQVSASRGIVATGDAHITVYLCENPWPPRAEKVNGAGPFMIFPYEDMPSNNDNFDPDLSQFDNTPIPPTEFLFDGYFNFRTYYCADAGATGINDDLPYLRAAVQTSTAQLEVLPNICELTGETCSFDKAGKSDCGTAYTDTAAGQKFESKSGQVCAGTLGNATTYFTDGHNHALDCVNAVDCSKNADYVSWLGQGKSAKTAVCKPAPVSPAPHDLTCFRERPLKRFLLTNPKSGDAIGIQVFENRNLLSASDWFESDSAAGGRGFRTNLQNTAIDGYPAVTDGVSYYIEALNYASSSAANNAVVNNLYGTIYELSINQNAAPEMRQVYDQIRKNLTLNANLTNYRYCGTSIENPGFAKQCTSDFDCVGEKSGTVCSAQKDKLQRNYQRLKDVNSIQTSLASYRAANGKFPELKSGSLLPGQTISTWPQSWTLLSDQLGANPPLPLDPINQLGAAGTCASSTAIFCQSDSQCPNKPNTQTPDTCLFHDPGTGWSVADRRFSFACATSSLAYRYKFSTSTGYELYFKTEDMGFVPANDAALAARFIIDPKKVLSNGANGICTKNEEVSSIELGRCGDGVVNVNRNEQCDPPGLNRFSSCDAMTGLITVDVCNNSCQWTASTTKNMTPFLACTDQSVCGNGKKEYGEVCDEGALNGKLNHCSTKCDGFVGNTCGNNVLDKGELCEITDTFANSRLTGWCVGGVNNGSPCDPKKPDSGKGDCNDDGNAESGAGICYSVLVASAKYGTTGKNASCGFDCKSRGPYCGDGKVDKEFGEECDTNQACSVAGTSGVRACSPTTCKYIDTSAPLWLKFSDYRAENPNTTYENFGTEQGIAATCESGKGCPAYIANEQYGGAVKFDPAARQTLRVRDAKVLMSTQAFSIEVRIKPDDYGVPANRVLEKGGWGVGPGYGIEFNLNRQVRFTLWAGKDVNSVTALDSTSTIPLNQWTTVTVTYEKRNINGQSVQAMRMFINGAFENERVENSKPDWILPNNDDLVIGNGSDPAHDLFFSGVIDDLRYYGRPLTAAEILDHAKNSGACMVKLAPDAIAVKSVGVCGNSVVEQSEACDQGNKNGAVCAPGYGKACTYCAKDCSNVVTIQPSQYCGNGVIEANEFCDTSPVDGKVFVANADPNTTELQKNQNSNGFAPLACIDEATDAGTLKKGTKICTNSCSKISTKESGGTGCIVCGITKSGGENVSGDIINTLDPESINPIYASNKQGETGALALVLDAPGALKVSGVGIRNWVAPPTTDYTLVPFADNAISSQNVIQVNSDPVCSFPNDPYYTLYVNGDSRIRPVMVQADPRNLKPWRYDLVLTPTIPVFGYNNAVGPTDILNADNTATDYNSNQLVNPVSARPNDIRLVVRWEGEGSVVAGIVSVDANNAVSVLESNMLSAVTTTFYYRNKLGWKTAGGKSYAMWYHGESDTANGSHALATTFDTWRSSKSGQMRGAQYLFYVRTADNSPIINYTTRNLRVELHTPSQDKDSRHFSTPTKVFNLAAAAPSANQKATFWQVLGINRADVGQGNLYDLAVDQDNAPQSDGRIVTGINQMIFTRADVIAQGP